MCLSKEKRTSRNESMQLADLNKMKPHLLANKNVKIQKKNKF